MKRIELEKISLSYFMSTGELVEHDFMSGITFVKGENESVSQEGQKNGCGKSVIFTDGVLFALYGKVTRDGFTQADIPYNRGAGKKKCVVQLSFSLVSGSVTHKVVVTRSINPSKLKVVVDGEDVSQAHSKSTQDDLVERFLGGIKMEVFKQSFALDIHTSNSFLTMSKVEREKFIGGVFDLTYIKEAQKMVRDDFNKMNKDTEVLNGKVSVFKQLIETTDSNISRAKLKIAEEEELHKARLETAQSNYDGFVILPEPKKIDMADESAKLDAVVDAITTKRRTILASQDTLKDKASSIKDVVTKHKDNISKIKFESKGIFRDIGTIQGSIDREESEISRIERSIISAESAKICPTCKRDMDEECRDGITATIMDHRDYIKLCDVKIEGLRDDIKQLEDFKPLFDARIEVEEDAIRAQEVKLADLRDEYTKINESKSVLDDADATVSDKRKQLYSKVSMNDTEIRQWEESKREEVELLNTITRLDATRVADGTKTILADLEQDANSSKADLEKIETEFSENVVKLEHLNHMKTLFGENGIREVILGRIVSLFNTTVNMYLARLETPCRLEFDSAFDCVMTSLGGNEIPVGGLSGGERVRLNTALAFTFKDILRIQNQITTNISIYDEWFDVSIDAKGLGVMAEILEERLGSYQESAYIITHRTELNIENSHTLTVVKEGGMSTIRK